MTRIIISKDGNIIMNANIEKLVLTALMGFPNGFPGFPLTISVTLNDVVKEGSITDDLLIGEEFYNLMQNYRYAPVEDQDAVIKAYEQVKLFIREYLRISKTEVTILNPSTKELDFV